MKYMKIDKVAITPEVRKVLTAPRRGRCMSWAEGSHVFVELFSPEGRTIKDLIPPRTWSVWSL